METSGQSELAVIDRFEGAIAVLLVGSAQRVVDVPRERLPVGVEAGQWLQVQLEGDVVMHAAPDRDATEDARQRIQEKLARLRRGDHLR
jgi:DUF3006 family protein